MQSRVRIYMTGVGGQGTLTATTLLAEVALSQGITVVSGEIHGMAQRGGVVESTISFGGWKSPKLEHGEADIILGFEPLETLRGIAYLRKGGVVFSSMDMLPPPSVSSGRESAPDIEVLKKAICERAGTVHFFPCRELGRQCGSIASGNTVLLGALAVSGLLPFGFDALEAGLQAFLAPKLLASNLKAAELGKQMFGQTV